MRGGRADPPFDSLPGGARTGGFGGSAEGWLTALKVRKPAHAMLNIAIWRGVAPPPFDPPGNTRGDAPLEAAAPIPNRDHRKIARYRFAVLRVDRGGAATSPRSPRTLFESWEPRPAAGSARGRPEVPTR